MAACFHFASISVFPLSRSTANSKPLPFSENPHRNGFIKYGPQISYFYLILSLGCRKDKEVSSSILALFLINGDIDDFKVPVATGCFDINFIADAFPDHCFTNRGCNRYFV